MEQSKIIDTLETYQLAAVVAAPVPVPAPIPAPAPATIPVALTGWSPSTITELEVAGVRAVSVDPRELVYMPAPEPMPVRAPPPIVVSAPVRLAAPPHPCPCPCAPSTHRVVGPRAVGCTRCARDRARARAPFSGMGRCRRPLPLSGASCRPPAPRPSIGDDIKSKE